MGLVDILSKKLKAAKYYINRAFIKTPNDFVFKDFRENFTKNDKVMEKQCKKILLDAKAIRKRREISIFIPDVEYELGEFTLDMMEITNSERFSTNFADLVMFARLYAINYVATDKGKTQNEIFCACNRLECIINALKFNFLTHVNIETDHWIEPNGDEMVITKKKASQKTFKALEQAYDLKINQEEGYVLKLLNMHQKLFGEILKIAQGIYDRDRDPIYRGFINLSDKDFYQLEDINQEEILGLQN